MNQLPSLKNAPWLADEPVRQVFAILNRDGDEGRAVGGAVRDELMGRQVSEVDFATTALPEAVIDRADAAGVRAVPTGIEHGTVTLVIGGRGFEVTTLRQDVETDGRHAVVSFGRDWLADAERRDFTINALSVDQDGTVYDPIGGYGDIVGHRVRFIGDADRRVAEDRLRILRFFRFHAQCGEGAIDTAGLAAAVRARVGILDLAAERINNELGRLLLAPQAYEATRTMQDAGILPVILGGIGYPIRLSKAIAFEAALGLTASSARRLTALSSVILEDAQRTAIRLRLANAERDQMLAAVGSFRRWTRPPDKFAAKAAIYRLGRSPFIDSLALAYVDSVAPLDEWARALRTLRDWEPPDFPVSGEDILAQGVLRGPMVGDILKQLESWWIDKEFLPDRAALMERLQEMQAGQQ